MRSHDERLMELEKTVHKLEMGHIMQQSEIDQIKPRIDKLEGQVDSFAALTVSQKQTIDSLKAEVAGLPDASGKLATIIAEMDAHAAKADAILNGSPAADPNTAQQAVPAPDSSDPAKQPAT